MAAWRALLYTRVKLSIISLQFFDALSIAAIRAVAPDALSPGIGYEWSGLTFQEIRAAGQTPLALTLALVFVFLFLAALYESWTMPVAVLLIAPVAMLGAVGAIWLRGLENNLFFLMRVVTWVQSI